MFTGSRSAKLSTLVDFKEFQGNGFKECQRQCFEDVSVSSGKRLALLSFFPYVQKRQLPLVSGWPQGWVWPEGWWHSSLSVWEQKTAFSLEVIFNLTFSVRGAPDSDHGKVTARPEAKLNQLAFEPENLLVHPNNFTTRSFSLMEAKKKKKNLLTKWHLSILTHLHFETYIYLHLFIFNWRIIALQYWLNSCHTPTWIGHRCMYVEASQVTLVVKNAPANAGDARDAVSIPGLGRSMATGSSVLAWRGPWTAEPGGL